MKIQSDQYHQQGIRNVSLYILYEVKKENFNKAYDGFVRQVPSYIFDELLWSIDYA